MELLRREFERDPDLEMFLVVVSTMLEPSGRVLMVSVVIEHVLPIESSTLVVFVVTITSSSSKFSSSSLTPW